MYNIRVSLMYHCERYTEREQQYYCSGFFYSSSSSMVWLGISWWLVWYEADWLCLWVELPIIMDLCVYDEVKRCDDDCVENDLVMKKLEGERWDSLFGLVCSGKKSSRVKTRIRASAVPNQRDTMMWRWKRSLLKKKGWDDDDDDVDMEEFIYLCEGIARIFPVVVGGSERERREKINSVNWKGSSVEMNFLFCWMVLLALMFLWRRSEERRIGVERLRDEMINGSEWRDCWVEWWDEEMEELLKWYLLFFWEKESSVEWKWMDEKRWISMGVVFIVMLM